MHTSAPPPAILITLPPQNTTKLRLFLSFRAGYVLATSCLARIRPSLSPYLAIWAQYGLWTPYFAGAQYGLWAPAMCSPLRGLRAYARHCRPISPSGLNTGSGRPISLALNTGFGLAMCSFHSAHTPAPLRYCPRAIRATHRYKIQIRIRAN